MSKKKSKLKVAQENAEAALTKTNGKIEELGKHASALYLQLDAMQAIIDEIRNIPSEEKTKYEELKEIRLNWKHQAEKIEADYRKLSVKQAGEGAAGLGAGIAVAALGPTAAMGIATTFGVASTGTAISTLSGAAATNAALAWLGGGALTAGGGGMAAGNALLALAGPVGIAIAGVALVCSGLMFWKASTDKKHLEDVFSAISKRDVKSYELATVELNERITRIVDEGQKLDDCISRVETFGTDYNAMSEAQQYELGAMVNLMNASTQLLINPILGLKPKFDADDLEKYVASKGTELSDQQKTLVVTLANVLYKIDLDEADQRRVWKSFRGNKKFIELAEISKKDFPYDLIKTVCDAISFKAQSQPSES